MSLSRHCITQASYQRFPCQSSTMRPKIEIAYEISLMISLQRRMIHIMKHERSRFFTRMLKWAKLTRFRLLAPMILNWSRFKYFGTEIFKAATMLVSLALYFIFCFLSVTCYAMTLLFFHRPDIFFV